MRDHVHSKVSVTMSAGVKQSKGFPLWKRNRGQKMYTATELYCTKTFGGDAQKLKRFLVAKGGFKRDQIGFVRVFQVADRQSGKMVHHARVFVRATAPQIESGIAKIETGRSKSVIQVSRMRWNQPNNTLTVRNFDILSGNDLRKMTRLFSKFGPLKGDIKMSRNRDGINVAEVSYREIEDARECERSQNLYRGDKLSFNGRQLQIGYAAQNDARNGNVQRR